MDRLGDVHFTFNTSGSINSKDNFKVYLDQKGNIIKNDLEYGVYNKIIQINFNKLFMLKLNYIGLGDVVDFITKITGIKKLIIFLTNGNCGCEKRRIKFNKFFKFYYPTFGFRKLYMDDSMVLQKSNFINPNKIKEHEVEILSDLQEFDKVEIEPPIQSHNTKPHVENKPLTTTQVRKSCNCSKKKKPL
jgi:hypothetical protein